MLYLKILAGYIHNFAELIFLNQIPCFINGFGIAGIKRILNKNLACFFRIIIIAVCKERASYKKLTLFADCCFLAFIINNHNITVITVCSYRKRLIITEFSVNDIICTYIRCFGRTVKIGIKNIIAKIINPIIKLLCRHNLTCKKHLFKKFGLCKIKQL